MAGKAGRTGGSAAAGAGWLAAVSSLIFWIVKFMLWIKFSVTFCPSIIVICLNLLDKEDGLVKNSWFVLFFPLHILAV